MERRNRLFVMMLCATFVCTGFFACGSISLNNNFTTAFCVCESGENAFIYALKNGSS